MSINKRDLLKKGVMHLREGLLDDAEKSFLKILSQDPHDFYGLQNLGLTYAHSGKLLEAKRLLLKASSINSNEAEPHYNLGLIYSLEKNFLEAIEEYKKALRVNPKHIEALTNLSDLFNQLGRHEEALMVSNSAINLHSSYAETWVNQAKALNQLDRKLEALDALKKTVEIQPSHADGLLLLADALDEQGSHEEALQTYDLLLKYYPNNHVAFCNKGTVLHNLKKYEDALRSYDNALSLQPSHLESLSNKGNTLNEMKRYQEALFAYDAALTIFPDYPEALKNKGNTLIELKRYQDALGIYERLHKMQPGMKNIKALIMHLKMHLCDWSNFEFHYEQLWRACTAGKDVCSPFISFSIFDSANQQKIIAERWVQSKQALFKNEFITSNKSDEKIRIGYYSPDFKNHPVSFLMAELIQLHDRKRFEVIGFSFGADNNNPMHDRLCSAFDQFINVQDKSEIEIALLSREMGIDIGIDLCGHTHENRSGIFSHRAAPVQVSYLGHPGTMGAHYIDYIIADPILIPMSNASHYTEKLIHLPHSFQINDRKRAIATDQLNKKDFGLPESGMIYCCFNNNFKITPNVFHSWMKILADVDNSVLWLLKDTPAVVENLSKECVKAGVDPARIIFAERISTELYLARYRLADLFLDTCPFNGGATASDALWAGLPIITKLGDAYAGRMAASLLQSIGLPELVTNSEKEYVELAQALGREPSRLASIKTKLAHNKFSTPLFNTPLNVQYIEAAFEKTMERYLNNQTPDHITINP
ncbi:tetratricopeptide repeat protein [Polynucleobacter campilacus]|uniref:protein O-GlcNAc transferase n=1 Tax=Polynucleobacter campilacus TaxID=1743163 RepID=A0A254Q5D0_9BURK|nr:tetratricopeptide repeat protein [Polynucleobacter campilacus]OWS70107.1 hypothetical protein CBI31_07230 [Polynucleobacter campilacus]